MSIPTKQHMISTSHDALAVEESGQGGVPVLLIHGNSFCRSVFRNQMAGQMATNRRLIAFDLPGHGESGDASDPTRSYTRPGFADAALELLDKLGVTEAIVFGWSLGGHIGIEMIPLSEDVWLGVILALYLPCWWFGQLKARRRDWWLSYL